MKANLLAVLVVAAVFQTARAQDTVADSGGDRVMALAFSPNGLLLAGGGLDKSVRLWDLKNNKVAHTFRDPRQLIRAVAFSPDSTLIAAASDDHEIYLWDSTSGKLKRALKGPEDKVTTSIQFSPNGKLIAGISSNSAFSNSVVTLWDATTGAVQHSLPHRESAVLGLSFSADSRTLEFAVARLQGEKAGSGFKRFETATGKEISSRSFDGEFGSVAVFSPDGKTLATGTTGAIRLWDLKSGKMLRTLSGNEAGVYQAFSFSPDGTTLVGGSTGAVKQVMVGDKMIQKVTSETRLWEVATGKLLWQAEGALGQVRGLSFSPDGKTLARNDDEEFSLNEPSSGTVREILVKASPPQ